MNIENDLQIFTFSRCINSIENESEATKLLCDYWQSCGKLDKILMLKNIDSYNLSKLNKHWHKEISLYTPIGEDSEGNQLCYADVIQSDGEDFGEGNNRILLRESIGKLPEKDKDIMLAVITGYKQREIAAMMGVQQSSISRRIKRIKRKLKSKV